MLMDIEFHEYPLPSPQLTETLTNTVGGEKIGFHQQNYF